MKRILVLCTGNSARSVLAEGILNGAHGDRFKAHSAGSNPTGRVNPMALEVLAAHGLPATGYASQSWDAFAGPDALPLDLVITVCDSAAGETCPFFPGPAMRAHWGIPDPAGAGDTPEEERAAFERAYGLLRARIDAFAALPDDLDADALAAELRRIGAMNGASEGAR
ncbi:arsenate reductase ArsC [Jannaschia sp. Os4]|uniref:arsenate reductase ArsC n=1 Tax=Jannaschia sp. Os4 TaxID=2807617 RepID=UPI00193A8265|nr:arsenate reductase ArsC [Jannaschia sp. Os4]MBM2575291.1 arsenate reductase ArsC [Jannaschia sp. Os4]